MAKKTSSKEKELEKGKDSDKKKNKPDSKGNESGNSLDNFQKFVKDSFSELKKIQWPSRRQAFGETVIVIITVVFLTSLVVLFDKVLFWLISFVI